ncbi:MAG: hypothetical protein U1E92_00270 [Moraxella osloensis]
MHSPTNFQSAGLPPLPLSNTPLFKNSMISLPCFTPDTDLDGYQFSVPNLHDKVEELLAIERDHQEKLQAQARERELEEQRLEQERLAQHRLEQERLENKRLGN